MCGEVPISGALLVSSNVFSWQEFIRVVLAVTDEVVVIYALGFHWNSLLLLVMETTMEVVILKRRDVFA